MQAILRLAGAIAAAAILSSIGSARAQNTQLSVPNVTVTAPATPIVPPYLRNPWKSTARNPYAGRYRVEEDKFTEVPLRCHAHRVLGRRQVSAGLSAGARQLALYTPTVASAATWRSTW